MKKSSQNTKLNPVYLFVGLLAILVIGFAINQLANSNDENAQNDPIEIVVPPEEEVPIETQNNDEVEPATDDEIPEV